MPGEQATLYGLALSHPSHAVRLMLDRKGIEHEFKELLPGFHPVQLRIAGFREPTVPALKIDGRRLQRSRTISIELDQICPEPPLFPADPVERVAVENAERWGEQELQPVPRHPTLGSERPPADPPLAWRDRRVARARAARAAEHSDRKALRSDRRRR
ncbi:MAG: glutathione S-transferase N-terminal domain-containing protein [Thermoleophilaceae bacterium]|nr:glutathione S-transferase N-terminal domain-containing protein [Thermoleophilaceae bacterium]